jgi:hypothetical protein
MIEGNFIKAFLLKDTILSILQNQASSMIGIYYCFHPIIQFLSSNYNYKPDSGLSSPSLLTCTITIKIAAVKKDNRYFYIPNL